MYLAGETLYRMALAESFAGGRGEVLVDEFVVERLGEALGDLQMVDLDNNRTVSRLSLCG